jgi:hypothetical protein
VRVFIDALVTQQWFTANNQSNSIGKWPRKRATCSRSAPEDYDIEDGRITAIYLVRNPDKLRHLH